MADGCRWCCSPLTGQQRAYCSAECGAKYRRNEYLKDTYGITLAQFNEILEFQGGVCYICKYGPVGKRVMVVDHEHAKGRSGLVRGILCAVCNLKFLGREKKSTRFRNAAEYLDNPPAFKVIGQVWAPGPPPKPRKRRARPKEK